MKTYKIPCYWQVWALMPVKAKNIEEAKEKALENPLPTDSQYIDSSFGIDEEAIPDYNEKEK